MSLKYNPFRPGSIVHPGMFAGRGEELETLEKALYQTKNGNASHFLIHGERGIGKSSLLYVTTAIAKGEIESLANQHYGYLTINIELEPADTYRDIITKIARELERELGRDDKLKQQLNAVWEFVTKWKVMGVEYKRESTPIEAMQEELADKIIEIAKHLATEKRGIYIFIDEADKPAKEANLGEFLKVCTERLTKRGAENVGIGVIGISSVIDRLRASHASSVRIFTPIELKPLAPIDRKQVVRLGLKRAKEKNGVETVIDDNALELISSASEGYPHFIQQYASCAFDEDTDEHITIEDVREAMLKDNGALHLLGLHYFESMYSEEIRSDDYRTVLQVLAQHTTEYVQTKQIIAESGLKRHTVANALNALKRRGSISAKQGVDGHFRIPSGSFAAWILAFKKGRR